MARPPSADPSVSLPVSLPLSVHARLNRLTDALAKHHGVAAPRSAGLLAKALLIQALTAQEAALALPPLALGKATTAAPALPAPPIALDAPADAPAPAPQAKRARRPRPTPTTLAVPAVASRETIAGPESTTDGADVALIETDALRAILEAPVGALTALVDPTFSAAPAPSETSLPDLMFARP